MERAFNTKIVFKQTLTDQEQFAFLKQAVKVVRKVEVSGSTHFENKLDCNIDYSACNLNESEVKKQFTRFLKKQKEIIQYYKFYKPTAA